MSDERKGKTEAVLTRTVVELGQPPPTERVDQSVGEDEANEDGDGLSGGRNVGPVDGCGRGDQTSKSEAVIPKRRRKGSVIGPRPNRWEIYIYKLPT